MVSGSEKQREKYFIRIKSNATCFYPTILYSPCILAMTTFHGINKFVNWNMGPWYTLWESSTNTATHQKGKDQEEIWLQPGHLSTLVYSMHLHRRPLTFVINVLVSISICGFLVFLLFPDYGEKVVLSVTILQSDSVFLLIIQESMPVQSLTIQE